MPRFDREAHANSLRAAGLMPGMSTRGLDADEGDDSATSLRYKVQAIPWPVIPKVHQQEWPTWRFRLHNQQEDADFHEKSLRLVKKTPNADGTFETLVPPMVAEDPDPVNPRLTVGWETRRYDVPDGDLTGEEADELLNKVKLIEPAKDYLCSTPATTKWRITIGGNHRVLDEGDPPEDVLDVDRPREPEETFGAVDRFKAVHAPAFDQPLQKAVKKPWAPWPLFETRLRQAHVDHFAEYHDSEKQRAHEEEVERQAPLDQTEDSTYDWRYEQMIGRGANDIKAFNRKYVETDAMWHATVPRTVEQQATSLMEAVEVTEETARGKVAGLLEREFPDLDLTLNPEGVNPLSKETCLAEGTYEFPPTDEPSNTRLRQFFNQRNPPVGVFDGAEVTRFQEAELRASLNKKLQQGITKSQAEANIAQITGQDKATRTANLVAAGEKLRGMAKMPLKAPYKGVKRPLEQETGDAEASTTAVAAAPAKKRKGRGGKAIAATGEAAAVLDAANGAVGASAATVAAAGPSPRRSGRDRSGAVKLSIANGDVTLEAQFHQAAKNAEAVTALLRDESDTTDSTVTDGERRDSAEVLDAQATAEATTAHVQLTNNTIVFDEHVDDIARATKKSLLVKLKVNLRKRKRSDATDPTTPPAKPFKIAKLHGPRRSFKAPPPGVVSPVLKSPTAEPFTDAKMSDVEGSEIEGDAESVGGEAAAEGAAETVSGEATAEEGGEQEGGEQQPACTSRRPSRTPKLTPKARQLSREQ